MRNLEMVKTKQVITVMITVSIAAKGNTHYKAKL